MKVLVINCGSSSLKYQLLDMTDESVICKGLCERIGIKDSFIRHSANDKEWKLDINFNNHSEAILKVYEMMSTGKSAVIKDKNEISVIGHRVAHGGEKFKDPVLITNEVKDTILNLSSLAPLHNPAHVEGINAIKEIFGDIKNVAVFDTAFHANMPAKAYMYAIPYKYYENNKIRKYGFHGTSHKYVSNAVSEYLGKDVKELKIISCHLGNGASLAAIKNGVSVDTSMGLTPLAGFMMGTRCGDLDPSVAAYISKIANVTGDQISDYLTKKSGFLGVSGISSDFRDVEKAANLGNERAKLTLEIYYYQIQKFIASYIVAMGGVDVLLFTAGIGENSATVRAGVTNGLECFNIEIDQEKNKLSGQPVIDISKEGSKVKTFIVLTNEEVMIARDAVMVISNL